MDDDRWNLIGYVIASKYRRKVLFFLKGKYATPKQISNGTDIPINHVSNILISLRKKNLVECKNPQVKRGRIYVLTKTAGEIVDNIDDNIHK
jgi:predicted transcriptional regulator